MSESGTETQPSKLLVVCTIVGMHNFTSAEQPSPMENLNGGINEITVYVILPHCLGMGLGTRLGHPLSERYSYFILG